MATEVEQREKLSKEALGRLTERIVKHLIERAERQAADARKKFVYAKGFEADRLQGQYEEATIAAAWLRGPAMTDYTWSDALAAEREREEVLEDQHAFIANLEKRPMSTWSDEELTRYELLTEQNHAEAGEKGKE